MTSVLTQDTATDRGEPPASSRVDRFRDAFQGGACVLSGVLVVAGMLLMPSEPQDYTAGTLFPVIEDSPTRYHLAHLCFALGLVLLAAVGLAVMRLTRARGAVLGTIGGLLLAIGGVAAGAAIWSYGAVSTTLASGALDPATDDRVFSLLEDSWYVGSGFLGFPVLLVGFIVSGIALFLARTVPRWAAVVLGLALIGPIVGEEGVVGAVAALPILVGVTVVGLALLRPRRR